MKYSCCVITVSRIRNEAFNSGPPKFSDHQTLLVTGLAGGGGVEEGEIVMNFGKGTNAVVRAISTYIEYRANKSATFSENFRYKRFKVAIIAG